MKITILNLFKLPTVNKSFNKIYLVKTIQIKLFTFNQLFLQSPNKSIYIRCDIEINYCIKKNDLE